MPLPTEAATKTAIGKWIKIFDDQLTPMGTYDTDEDAYLTVVPSDPNPQASAAAAGPRGALNSLFGMVSSALVPLLTTYARVLNLTYSGFDDAFERLYVYYAENAKRVKSRVFTFGAPSACVGTGTGLCKRLTKDRYNFDIETPVVETKTLECIADQNTAGGKLGTELFLLRGAVAAKDGLVRTGSGIVLQIEACGGARPTSAFLQNQSFDTYTGAAISTPTDLNGWSANVTIDSTAFEFVESSTFRTYDGVTTARSLEIKGNCHVYQVLRSKIQPGVPMYCRVAWNRQVGVCDGTLTLRLGAVSKAVVMAAQVGWQLLQIDLTSDAWFRNFDQASLDLRIEWSGRTTGYLLIDDVVLAPMTAVDGTWIAVDPGATAFKLKDSFSYVDAAVEGAKLQYWFARTLGKYLPGGTGGAITWSDP